MIWNRCILSISSTKSKVFNWLLSFLPFYFNALYNMYISPTQLRNEKYCNLYFIFPAHVRISILEKVSCDDYISSSIVLIHLRRLELYAPLEAREFEENCWSDWSRGNKSLKMLWKLFGWTGITREYIWAVVPLSGWMIGSYLDHRETERMVMFRDKSALYGHIKKEGDKPTWPNSLIFPNH